MDLEESAKLVEGMVEPLQKAINENLARPEILIMLAGTLMNMGKEIMTQVNGPTQTLEMINYYKDLVEQEKNNTTIH